MPPCRREILVEASVFKAIPVTVEQDHSIHVRNGPPIKLVNPIPRVTERLKLDVKYHTLTLIFF